MITKKIKNMNNVFVYNRAEYLMGKKGVDIDVNRF